jgi:hypothetical protein
LRSLRCLGSKRSNIWKFYVTKNTNVLSSWTVVMFSSHPTKNTGVLYDVRNESLYKIYAMSTM